MNNIIDLVTSMVKISSQGGIDNYENILGFIYKWVVDNELNGRFL